MKITKKEHEDTIQHTKEYIINTARGLISKYCYSGVSMNDIAKKLNITKAALYYHFINKAEIYKKVLDEAFNGLNAVIIEASKEKTADKKLHQLIKNYLSFGLKEKTLIKSLMLKLSPSDPQVKKHIIQLRKSVINLIQPIVKQVSVNRKSTQKIDPKLLTSLLTGMMDGLILEYSLQNVKIDLKKVSNQIITVLFNV